MLGLELGEGRGGAPLRGCKIDLRILYLLMELMVKVVYRGIEVWGGTSIMRWDRVSRVRGGRWEEVRISGLRIQDRCSCLFTYLI